MTHYESLLRTFSFYIIAAMQLCCLRGDRMLNLFKKWRFSACHPGCDKAMEQDELETRFDAAVRVIRSLPEDGRLIIH